MIARMGKTRFIICAALVLVVCAAMIVAACGLNLPEATGKTVIALPIEATAIGNLKIQIARSGR